MVKNFIGLDAELELIDIIEQGLVQPKIDFFI